MATKGKSKGLKKLRLTHWLTIIGGLTLFSSWFVERNFQNNWTDQKENLKRSQLVIDITEVNRSTYELAYYAEVQKPKIDTPIVAFIQQRLARVYLDLLTWSKGRVTDDAKGYNVLINAKRQIDEDNRKYLSTHEYVKISKSFNNISQVFGKTYMSLDNEYSDKVDLVNENEKYWSDRFSFLYILGSVILGIAFIVEKTKGVDE